MNKLGKYLTIKHGWAFKGEFFSDTGTQSLLTPGNFYEQGGFKVNEEKARYYSGDYPEEYLCHQGDLIVAMTEQAAGLLGSTGIVPEDNRYLHNQRVGLVQCDEQKLLKMYAYYLFMTKSVRDQIAGSSSGTKVKHTSPEKIYDVKVSIPDLSIQKKISSLLWLIDSKIQNNNQICEELESMAKTIYDYWFTQFDFPNAEGKPYRSSGGKMVWNEQLKREIPEGWGTCCLSDIAYLDAVSVNPKDYGNMVMEHYSIPAFDDTHFPSFEPSNTIESNKYIVHPDSILTSKLNPQFKRLWDPYCQTENAICSTEFLVYRPTEQWMRPYCYAVLNSEAFYQHMVGKATSSTGSRKRIQPDVSAAFQFALPPESVIREFVALYAPIMKKMKASYLENKELTQLRDWLLPMLMNGQATIE